MVRLVTQVFDHRQLLREHLLRDLFEHLRAGNLIRESGHHDRAVVALVPRAQSHTARSAFVHREEVLARGDDLGLGRKVRTEYVLAEVCDRRLRFVNEPHAGGDDFAKVVRRHVGRHADRDSRRSVQQDVGKTGRQQLRLIERPVEVRIPLDGSLAQLPEQDLGESGELRFRVSHRREGLGIVRGSPVSLTVNQRIPRREGLCEQYHRLVAGALPVRVKLAEDVAHGSSGFLVLRSRGQAELRHRVDDAPLHRLQTIADMGQGAIQNHVHRVVEIGLFGELLQRTSFDLLELE